ncbi:MAG: DUF4333 domain-containing protein [Solirubrobacterales bacterium]
MMPSRRILLPLATLATAILLAGCEASCSTGDDTVSSDELSVQVKDALETSVGAPLKSVDCDEVKAEVGEPISCDAVEPNGDKLKIEGKITSVDEETQDVKFNVQVVS